MINKIKERKIILSCLIYQQSQVQEENHSSMQAISQGNPAIEIAHFERIGLDGLSSNSLVLTRQQTFRGREGNSLLVHAYYHTLAHSLFFLSDSFFFSKFLFSLLSFTPFLTSFSLILSLLFSIFFRSIYCAQLRPFLYCLPWWVFNYFTH